MDMEASRGSPSYYSILGVSMDSSNDQIRRAYRKLAMQWHPDKWARNPSLLGQAKRKFQQIQEAYSVLSDQRKRSMYDIGLYDPQDEEDEGFADFLQEMSSLMQNSAKKEEKYSFGEIQSMFWEMAESFNFPGCSDSNHQFPNDQHWFEGMFTADIDSRRSFKRARPDGNPLPEINFSGRWETGCV